MNVHLHCILRNLKTISKILTFPPPLEKFLRTPMHAHTQRLEPYSICVLLAWSTSMLESYFSLFQRGIGSVTRNLTHLPGNEFLYTSLTFVLTDFVKYHNTFKKQIRPDAKCTFSLQSTTNDPSLKARYGNSCCLIQYVWNELFMTLIIFQVTIVSTHVKGIIQQTFKTKSIWRNNTHLFYIFFVLAAAS